MGRKKLEPIKKLKLRWIDTFQMYVRYRDGWTCICCGIYIDPHSPTSKNDMHAGHYITRGNGTLIADEFNVNAECGPCNKKEYLTKDKNPYTLGLILKYGPEVIKYLETERHKITKRTRQDYLDDIKKWEAKIEEFKQNY
jgi:hypothetical protein